MSEAVERFVTEALDQDAAADLMRMLVNAAKNGMPLPTAIAHWGPFERLALAAPSAAPGEAVSEAWHDVRRYLAHRDDDEFWCREHGDGPGTCDCGLTPAVDRLTAALRAAPAPVRVSEAVPEDERCEDCGTRRATVHVESASVNELCEGCYIARLERQVSLPHAVARRLLGRFIQNLGYKCRLDADGYCQAHFLEKPCVVAEAREVLAALAAQEGSRG